MNLGKCEKCPETAIGFNGDGDALCSDCLFESTCDDVFGETGEDG